MTRATNAPVGRWRLAKAKRFGGDEQTGFSVLPIVSWAKGSRRTGHKPFHPRISRHGGRRGAERMPELEPRKPQKAGRVR